MMQDRSRPTREAIARDLTDLAVRAYGREAAGGLEGQIRDTAGALALVMEVAFDTWADEPDFLVAPGWREG